MQKRGVMLVLVVSLVILLSIFMVSAFSFSGFFDKLFGGGITGKVTSSIACNSDQFGGNGVCSGILSNCTSKTDQVASAGINISSVERIDIIEQGCYVPSGSVPWGGSRYQCPAGSVYDVCFRNGNDGNANYVYLGIVLKKPNCTDSDIDSTHQDGLNYYVMGNARGYFNEYELNKTLEDSCCNPFLNNGQVAGCENSGNRGQSINEAYCSNNKVAWYSYPCPDGCYNGACTNLSSIESIYTHILSAVTAKLASSDKDFDLNNNGEISIGDQQALKNFYFGEVSYRQANILVLNKILSAINNRLNVQSTNANYLAGLDLNDDGTITSTDYALLKSVFGQGLIFTASVDRCGELGSVAKVKIAEWRNLSNVKGVEFVDSEGGSAKKLDHVVIYSPRIVNKMRILRVSSIPNNMSESNAVRLTDVLTGETYDFYTGTGQTAHNMIDGNTYYLYSYNYAASELDRYVVLTWGIGSDVGNVGDEKDSFNCVSPQDCTDSDGENYYTPGTATGSLFGSEPYQAYEDSCYKSYGNSLAREYYCDADRSNTLQVADHACFSGKCVGGACVQPYECKNITSIITLQPGEDTSFTVSGRTYHILLVQVLQDAYAKINYEFSDSPGMISKTIRSGQVYQIDNDVYIEVTSAYLSGYVGDLPTKASFLLHSNCQDQSDVQVCSDLIDSIKNPTETEDRRLSWNSTYDGTEYFEDSKENYTTYYASWYWNSPEYQKDQMNYYYVSYETQVFDNRGINLSNYMSWNEHDPACKMNSYWVGNVQSNYYICNWDALNNRQSLDNYQGTARQIFWYHNNVIVRMYMYYGTQLSDEQVAKLSALKINELLNNLQNNQAKSVDWSNFNIDYPASDELSNTIRMCGSDLPFNWSNGYYDWSCKTEPIICPEYGYQTRTCTRYNPALQKDDVQESRMGCSPGICSGCYEPRYYGAVGDNTCIPYGFRLAHQTGEHFELVERTQNDSIPENSGKNGEYSLVINSANEAILSLMTDYTLQTMENFTLIPGKSVEIKMSEGSQSRTMKLNVIAIHPSVGDTPGYVELTVSYMENQQIIESFNAYCDIDGQIKEQKTKDSYGNGAKCQNNYECSSNVCSDGECIDLKSAVNEVSGIKKLLIRILCKVSNLADDSNSSGYNSCIAEFGVDGTNF